jgi:signal peptidase I
MKKKSGLRENLEAIIIAVILALFIRTFVVQAFKIPSGSMEETLLVGDHILVNKFTYGIKLPFSDVTLISMNDPEREDIIVFKYPKDPSKDYIKRVVGLPGDEIEVRDRTVYINGKIFKRDYTKFTYSGARANFGPVTVPEKSLFVLGDNRDNSQDSRVWGFVKLNAVKGKAFMIYWSWNSRSEGSILDHVRWNRLGNGIR